MRSTLLLLLALLAGAAGAETYDFAYTATGDPRLTPLQVFDNGKRTWLQLPQLNPQPVVFAITTAGEVMLPARTENQMLVIDRVEQQLAIVLGRARVNVRYVGTTRRQDDAAMFGATAPAKISGSAPAPMPADKILAAHKEPMAIDPEPAKPQKETAPIEVAQKSPAEQKAVADEKKNTAVPIADGSTTPGADQTPVVPAIPTEWEVKPEDQDLQTLLRRWAVTAGWQISWEATKPYPVNFHATLHGGFADAAHDALLPYTVGADPIKGCTYDNNVLRVVPKPTVCKLK